MPYVLPAAFVDHVALYGEPDLAAACHAAPLAYLTSDSYRRVQLTVGQAARLHAVAETLVGIPGDPLDAEARQTLRTLAPAAAQCADHKPQEPTS
ncbi:hypothetical protein ACH4S8_37945 [Streptomyces sp. NPDC021080]|uniref:hypothetical protein n=1 Tax=Streptomyces sp. NPDC021080 TaxID=3365110 RepID=UPI0037B823A4